jgi:hypothetical protein
MKPTYVYQSISRGVSLLMDGGKPYNFDGVLWRPPTFSGLSEIFRFGLGFGSIQNRTGVTIAAALGARLDRTSWKAGQWVNATTTYTDDTRDAQDSDLNDFALETTTNNDGWALFGYAPINCVCLDIGTASLTGTPVRTIEYTKAGGTWGSITNLFVPPVSGGHWAVGEAIIMWVNPTDLAVSEAGHGTGVPLGLYGYRFRSTTAPTGTAALANSLSCAQVARPISGLADTIIYEYDLPSGEHYFDAACDAMVAVLSSKAAVQSMIQAEVRVL